MLTQADSDPISPFSPFDFASRGSVLAAVSGGSDSTALLVLFLEFLQRHAPETRLVAATIDHGLRAASSAEAAAVAEFCAGRGIAHRTLAWTGAKPKTGIPAAAREARYRLLALAAREAGTDIVMTGHTADDQVETVAMRSARGDGRGLAGMAPATLYDGSVWIVRPLLSMGRDALRETLRARGIGWIDDPTNADHAYERPRVREALTAQAASSAMQEKLSAIALAAKERRQKGYDAARVIDTHASRHGPEQLCLDHGFARSGDEAAVYAFRLLLATVGQAEHLPDLARSTELFRRLGQVGLRATLSRCLIEVTRDSIILSRERRGASPAAPIPNRVVPFARFLPAFDLAPAAALARLVGAPRIPAPPFVGGTPFPGHD